MADTFEKAAQAMADKERDRPVAGLAEAARGRAVPDYSPLARDPGGVDAAVWDALQKFRDQSPDSDSALEVALDAAKKRLAERKTQPSGPVK